jgi:hypothetical protein
MMSLVIATGLPPAEIRKLTTVEIQLLHEILT